MNKTQKTLTEITLSGILLFSGCSGMIRNALISKDKPVDLTQSHYKEPIEKKADNLSENTTIDNLKKATKAYGSIGELDKMDKTIKQIINKDLDYGLRYSEMGDKYHEIYKK